MCTKSRWMFTAKTEPNKHCACIYILICLRAFWKRRRNRSNSMLWNIMSRTALKDTAYIIYFKMSIVVTTRSLWIPSYLLNMFR